MKIFLMFIVFVASLFSAINLYISSSIVHSIYPRGRGYEFIAHAGGGIESLTYTNSLEAVNSSLLNGFKAIELDLIKSSDGVLIAGHDWKHFKTIIGHRDVDDIPMDSLDIKDYKIHNKYTILTGADISKLLSDNPDLILFTDKSNDFSLIKKLGFNSRVYVEVFGILDFLKAIRVGIKNPMLNVDVGSLGPLPKILYVMVTNPNFVVLSSKAVNEHPEYLNWLFNRGIKIFIYTSDEPCFINKMSKIYDATIYTDFYRHEYSSDSGPKLRM